MEQEHLIIVAVLAVILYMLMKHSQNCNCGSCMQTKMIEASKVAPLGHIMYVDDPNFATGPPAHIRMRRDELLPEGASPLGHIRVSDKYIGEGQTVKGHIRYDNRKGMFHAMFSGNPLHIRYEEGNMTPP